MSIRTKSRSLRRLVVAILVFPSILAIASRLEPIPGVLVLLVGMVILGITAWLWGWDSWDGADWKRR